MKPCRTCGDPLVNRATTCDSCGSEQVDPFASMPPPAAPPPRRSPWWHLGSEIQLVVIFSVFCAVVGAALGGLDGAVIGLVIGFVASSMLQFG